MSGIKDSLAPLLEPFKPLKQLAFLFTSSCNLRCVYCPQSLHPENHDASPWLIRHILDFVRDTGIQKVTLGFYGDTLCYKGWETYTTELLDMGVDLNLCSNFNHRLSENEILTLSRFKEIQYSIDTIDRDVFKAIRPPADIRTILHNLVLINSKAICNNTPKPKTIWNCTLTNKVTSGLEALVGSAIHLGVSRIVFNELVRFQEASGGVKSIFELEGTEFIEALEHLEKAQDLATDAGIEIKFSLQYWDKLVEIKKEMEREQTSGDSVTKLNRVNPLQAIQGTADFHAERTESNLLPNQTRMCPEPWSNIFISAEGDIFSCCVRGQSLGRITQNHGIGEILRNASYRDLRRQLLTGNVTDKSCKECPLLPAGDIEPFVQSIRQGYQTIPKG